MIKSHDIRSEFLYLPADVVHHSLIKWRVKTYSILCRFLLTLIQVFSDYFIVVEISYDKFIRNRMFPLKIKIDNTRKVRYDRSYTKRTNTENPGRMPGFFILYPEFLRFVQFMDELVFTIANGQLIQFIIKTISECIIPTFNRDNPLFICSNHNMEIAYL